MACSATHSALRNSPYGSQRGAESNIIAEHTADKFLGALTGGSLALGMPVALAAVSALAATVTLGSGIILARARFLNREDLRGDIAFQTGLIKFALAGFLAAALGTMLCCFAMPITIVAGCVWGATHEHQRPFSTLSYVLQTFSDED